MKFLFFSPHTLADSSSGAARSVQTLLAELNVAGHQCMALTATMIDGKNHLFDQAMLLPPVDHVSIEDSGIKIPIRKVIFQDVEHIIVGAKATTPAAFLAYEESILKSVFIDVFVGFQPDVVITYGGYTSSFFGGQYAMANGRKSVLYAASSSYAKKSDFVHVNRVISVSKALSNHLLKATQLPIVTIPPMVTKADAVCEERKPEFITFMNPRLDKGLKLAVAIAQESLRRNKGYKFLFVESRGTKATAHQQCPELAQCSNVAFAENVSNVRAIYEVTRVLLFPSLWFETAGIVAIQANMNGIPILASNVGGIPEMLDGAGYMFTPPEAMLKDWATPPPLEYLDQWLSVLDRLHNDPAEMNAAVTRAQSADKRYNVRALAQRFVGAVS